MTEAEQRQIVFRDINTEEVSHVTDLDVLSRDSADAAALDDAARRGYSLALISCTPAGEAVLLRHDAGAWREIDV